MSDISEPGFSLEGLLQWAADRMKLDLRQRLIDHPGELGTDREEVIRSFLKSYLPKRFEVSTGFVFDSSGSISKQIDIIITDSLVCAHFQAPGGTRLFPCEAVVAVGQIKSSLTSFKDLRGSIENIESVKSLDRSAQGKAFDSHYQENIDHQENYLHQIFGFILVIGKSLSLSSIQEHAIDYTHAREAHLWPNIFIALDQYLVTFCCDDGVCPNPMHARGIAYQKADDGPDLIMRFFILLGRAIEVTRVSALPYWHYLDSAQRWTAEVHHSTMDDPPPLLSSLGR